MNTSMPARLAVGVLVSAASAAAADGGLPDLTVSEITLSHDKAAPDTVVGVTFSVKNQGNADAGPFRIAIYHSDGLVVPTRGNVTRIGAMRSYLGIARGQSETFRINVRLPPCTDCKPGSIYAYADAWGNVLESSGYNNFKAAAIDVSTRYRPNLRVSNVSLAPDRGAIGKMATLGAKLTNDSAYVAYGPVKLGIYCSRDFSVDARDTLLQTFTHVLLGPGQSVAVNKIFRVDPACAVHGQHTQIGLLADFDDSIIETDEGDNGQLAPYWVLRAPDVTPGVVAIEPRSGTPGTPVVVSFTATNAGSMPVGPVEVGVYMGKSPNITVKDRRFAGRTLASLPPGKTTMTLQDDLFVPDLPSGTYYVGVIVDEKGEAGELREHNNEKTVPFRLVRPNLTDRFFFVDQSKVRPGQVIDVRFSLRNLGLDAAGAFRVGFYYSDDPRYDASDTRVGTWAFQKLGKGDERAEHKLQVTIPARARSGYHYLIMVTDDDNEVVETDELDNFTLRPLLVER
ncbi:MAG: CARDB domain-containing protein [Polyangiaceae bacterium]